jgi:hypothetical protein
LVLPQFTGTSCALETRFDYKHSQVFIASKFGGAGMADAARAAPPSLLCGFVQSIFTIKA